MNHRTGGLILNAEAYIGKQAGIGRATSYGQAIAAYLTEEQLQRFTSG